MTLKIESILWEVKKANPRLTEELFSPAVVCKALAWTNADTTGKKLRGERALNDMEMVQLADYLKLGADGAELFKQNTVADVRWLLSQWGYGRYSENPARRLCLLLDSMAMQSDASLDFFEPTDSTTHRGFERLQPETKTQQYRTFSPEGRTRVRFTVPAIEIGQDYFLLLNLYETDQCIKVICPVFASDAWPMSACEHFFPSHDPIRIYDANKKDDHRLYGIRAGREAVEVVLNCISDKVRVKFGPNIDPDEVTRDRGQLKLSPADATLLLRTLENDERFDCAQKPYTLV